MVGFKTTQADVTEAFTYVETPQVDALLQQYLASSSANSFVTFDFTR